MLYAYAASFDVTWNLENFLELNKTLVRKMFWIRLALSVVFINYCLTMD